MLEVQTFIQNEFTLKERKTRYQTTIFYIKNSKQSIKVMVSACFTWNWATKPFFVNGCGVKMNAKAYKQHI